MQTRLYDYIGRLYFKEEKGKNNLIYEGLSYLV